MTEPQAEPRPPLSRHEKFWLGVGVAVIVISVLLMVIG